MKYSYSHTKTIVPYIVKTQQIVLESNCDQMYQTKSKKESKINVVLSVSIDLVKDYVTIISAEHRSKDVYIYIYTHIKVEKEKNSNQDCIAGKTLSHLQNKNRKVKTNQKYYYIHDL